MRGGGAGAGACPCGSPCGPPCGLLCGTGGANAAPWEAAAAVPALGVATNMSSGIMACEGPAAVQRTVSSLSMLAAAGALVAFFAPYAGASAGIISPSGMQTYKMAVAANKVPRAKH